MGMARSDFEGCTPEEFFHAHAQWAEREQQHERAAWEQTRIIALCTLQPHSSHPLTHSLALSPAPPDVTGPARPGGAVRRFTPAAAQVMPHPCRFHSRLMECAP